MRSSAESVVREFLGAWANPKADELASFLSDEAIWVDGPQGVRRGRNAIIAELIGQLAISRGIGIEVDTLLASGGTVMVEWHGVWTMGGNPITAKVMATFEIDPNGRISQMREYYDLQSLIDQIESAGFPVTK